MGAAFLEAGVKEQVANTISKRLGLLFVVVMAITGAVVLGTGASMLETVNEDATPFHTAPDAFFGAMPAGAFIFGAVGFLLRALGKRYFGQ